MRELFGFWVSLGVLLAVVACGKDKPCDIDGHRRVNDADDKAFQATFGLIDTDEGFNKRADFDGDGVVAGSDFSAYQAKCGGE